MINSKRLNLLRKVIEKGYTDEAAVKALTAEQMVSFCKTVSEMADILELQKALKENRLISYLSEKK